MIDLSKNIKSIQDIMRKDAGVDGDAQRLGQIAWMFFLKIFDDNEKESELLEEKYQSPIIEKYRWRNWADNREGITGDELLDFINNQLFIYFKNEILTSSENKVMAKVIKGLFEDANNYMKSGTLMRQVINKINEFNFNAKDQKNIFGDIYEQLLKQLQSAGNAGEFYTPRGLIDLMVEIIDPKLDESVLDPATGTGGFLTSALEHKRKYHVKSTADTTIVDNSIYGFEKKTLPYNLCITNLILHNLKTPSNILHQNTLVRPLKDYNETDEVDIILSNPPFGGNEEDGIEDGFPSKFKTRETADLFLVLIIKLLKKNGRAAIILPDSFLFGDGVKNNIKEYLFENCNLHTILRLPGSVFAPYTPIKTNVLFIEKSGSTKKIHYYEHKIPKDLNNYNKTRPIKKSDMSDFLKWYKNKDLNNNKSWTVSIEEIRKNNFNLDINNPFYKETANLNFNNLINSLNEKNKEISNLQNEIKLRLKQINISNNILNKLDVWSIFEKKDVSNIGRKSTNLSNSFEGINKLQKYIIDQFFIDKFKNLKNFNNHKIINEQIKNNKLEIKKGWSLKKIKDLGKIYTGNSINKEEKERKYTNTIGVPYLATKDIGYGWDKPNYDNGISIPENLTNFRYVKANTPLICSEGGSAGKKSAITLKKVCIGNKLIAIDLYENINPEYILLNYLSNFFTLQFQYLMTGIIPGISLKSFNNILIPMPDTTEEQIKIAKEFNFFNKKIEILKNKVNQKHAMENDILHSF